MGYLEPGRGYVSFQTEDDDEYENLRWYKNTKSGVKRMACLLEVSPSDDAPREIQICVRPLAKNRKNYLRHVVYISLDEEDLESLLALARANKDTPQGGW